MTSAILQRSEAKPMRVATWGFADNANVSAWRTRMRTCSKTPGGDVTSAVLQRSEAKPMRVATWGFADSANRYAQAKPREIIVIRGRNERKPIPRSRSKTPGGDVTSAILQRSEAKPMRVATWGFADNAKSNEALRS